MRTYHVTWEIEVFADNPVDAAVEALQIQKCWKSIAKVFGVTEMTRDGTAQTERVDLDELPRLSLCDECGAKDASVGCPDGAQICQGCFDMGLGHGH